MGIAALLIVDVQNDFMPFGSLPVPDGDAVVGVANRLAPEFELVVATQDWHPGNHASFASSHGGRSPGEVVQVRGRDQMLWPDHCVQETPGASFHSALDVGPIDLVVRKGTDPGIDSYSAFYDNHHEKDTGLAQMLRERNVDHVWLAGVATDYCVLYTALDARELGFSVTVVENGVRAVDVTPGDGARAIEQMALSGCAITSRGL